MIFFALPSVSPSSGGWSSQWEGGCQGKERLLISLRFKIQKKMNLSRIQADLVQSIMMDNSSECGSWHPGEQQVVDTCAFWLEGIRGQPLR